MKTGRASVLTCQAILLIAFLGGNSAHSRGMEGEARTIDEYLTALPAELSVDDAEPQKYSVTSIIHNRDIAGNANNRIRLTAEYTRRVEDGRVHCLWNDVRVAGTQDPSEPFVEGNLLDYMEGFSYTVSEDIMGEQLFKVVSDENTKHLVKTLVWDAATFEPHFWDHFEKFELNEQYVVSDFEDFDVQMGEWGTLKMRDLRMAWVGVSRMNGETCALIEYASFSNPVKSSTGAVSIDGRSLYWGSLWISLKDKQVECATLNEDVMMEITFADSDNKTILDMQRDVVFVKSN